MTIQVTHAPSVTTEPKKFGFGGGAFAAAANAMALLRDTLEPISITIYEKDGEAQHGGGRAYGDNTAGPEHYLNLQGGRVSTDQQKPADATMWQRSTSGPGMHAGSEMPRRDFRKYTLASLEKALQEAPEGSTITWVDEEALHLDISGAGKGTVYTITSGKNGAPADHEKSFDSFNLTTGNLASKVIPEIAAAQHIPGVVVDQYSKEGRGTITDAATKDPSIPMVVIGQGLGGSDVVITADSHNHTGQIGIVSTGGHRNHVYPENYANKPLDIHISTFKSPFERKVPGLEQRVTPKTTLAEFDAMFGEALKKAVKYVKKYDTVFQGDEGIATEKALEILQPHLSKAIANLSDPVKKAWFAQNKSFLTARRIGVVSKTGDIVRKNEQSGRVTFHKSGITGITVDPDAPETVAGPMKIVHLTNGENLRAGVVVQSPGPNNDYSVDPKTLPPLWGDIMARGIGSAHPLGGVRVNDNGKMITADGRTHHALFAAGVPVSGNQIEKGQVGPFQLNIPTIVAQANINAPAALEAVGVRHKTPVTA